MEEFKKDLIHLFDKHGYSVLCDSIELSVSPLHVELGSGFTTRDFVFRFTACVFDKIEAKNHSDKHGCIIK